MATSLSRHVKMRNDAPTGYRDTVSPPQVPRPRSASTTDNTSVSTDTMVGRRYRSTSPAASSPTCSSTSSLTSSSALPEEHGKHAEEEEEEALEVIHVDETEEEEISTGQPLTTDVPEVGPAPDAPHSARKGKKAPIVLLDDHVEQELSEWFKQHPILYDKGLKDYKDPAKKARLFEEKAASLEPPLTG